MSALNFELIDIPIEFKEINPSDFDSQYYKVEDKIIITPDEKGFISHELLPELEKGIDEKNTVVINAGVGQGKSRAILEMANKYSSNNDYVVIIAVPYKNLIEQYINDCLKFTTRNRIFNQLEIEKEKIQSVFDVSDEDIPGSTFSMSKFKIHVLTTNGLLGNPGDDSLFQAGIKRKYFEDLQNYCHKKRKKLVIIFDEIHDSIHNFREELIINLWSYQGLVHKIFTVSATYNEASKEVIKYLSELTNRKIQIIEAKRTIIKEKQSELFINFYTDKNIERDKELITLLKDLKEKEKRFDIAIYSSGLAKKFVSKPSKDQKYFSVNHLLYDLNINRCYNDKFDFKAKQVYNQGKINIGTNFTTGVNIEKLNHDYIIILPKEVSLEYFNNKGTFTNGANTIIQTFARQRKKGRIHIFLPVPLGLKEETLKYDKGISKMILSNFDSLGIKPAERVSYSDINKQEEVLDQVYQNLFYRVKNSINKLEKVDRTGMNQLEFPKKELFKLYKGEKYLAENFFGGNLSTYVLWAAMCNQFLNCKLANVHVSRKIYLTSRDMENEVSHIYNSYKDSLNSSEPNFAFFDSFLTFEKWEYFKTEFFVFNEVLVDDKQLTQLYKDKIMSVLLKLIFEEDLNADKSKVYLNYLKSSIYSSKEIDLNEKEHLNIKEENLILIKLFKEWGSFVELLENKKKKRKENIVLPSKMFLEFHQLFSDKKMVDVLNEMMIKDFVISNKNFPIYDRFRKCETEKQYAKSFYKLLIEVLYDQTKAEIFKVDSKNVGLYVLNDVRTDDLEQKNILYKPKAEFYL